MEKDLNNDLAQDLESSPAQEPEAVLVERERNEAVEIGNGKLDLRKGGNIVIGTLNVMADPFKKHLKKRHERFYKKSQFHLWADLSLVLAILSLAAAFVIIKNFEPKPEIYLKASVAGERVVSASLSVFTIDYRNNGKIDVDDASLSLTWPKNFKLISVQPEAAFSDQTNTFEIGDLPRGANGQVKISGAVLGSLGESATLAYSLNYLQKGKQFNNLGSLMFPIESSALSVVLEVPNTIYKDVDFGGKIVLKNQGKVDLDKVVELAFDDPSVKIKSVSGDRANLINGVAVWDGLRAGEQVEIEFEAASQMTAAQDISLSAYVDLDGVKARQATAKSSVMVLAPKFKTTISTDAKYLKNDQPVIYKLSLENNESVSMENVRMDFAAADSAFVLKGLSLKEAPEGYVINGTSLVVENMAPGGKLELVLEALLSRKKINPNQETGLSMDLSYRSGSDVHSYKVYGQKLKVVSDLQVSSRAVYYSAQGDQLGVGPLPPAVDIPTRYWIFWEADNLGNDLKDFMVSAELPANVGWTDQKSLLSGKVRYAPIGRKVIWTVDDMPKEGGQYRAGFEVELIPSQEDLGKVPELLIATEYSATDIYAETEVSGKLDNLSADLKGDNLASGKGKVIKMNVIK